MAQRVTLVDDIDGTTLDGHGSTVTFRVDGVDYEIDLSSGNRERFSGALEPFVEAARKVRVQGGRQVAKTSVRAASDPSRLAAIRAWAKENGYEVSDRGRIARTVVDAYEAAH
ncbi:histone-like nucleoid-structuring protein Lsr2 [Rathayibacter rathayi]|uniref:histone-like nucleoid-structuring protein Lsr2 n=1 Tax=Rathayibacter rathayi TaxID=33887 RepID=UPI000CE922ED|nr:Lsr2 family protein [Rathayibacter rathayi]PPH34142.1 hypothetical protein C5C28_10050 [Rathayibacter rathayi]